MLECRARVAQVRCPLQGCPVQVLRLLPPLVIALVVLCWQVLQRREVPQRLAPRVAVVVHVIAGGPK